MAADQRLVERMHERIERLGKVLWRREAGEDRLSLTYWRSRILRGMLLLVAVMTTFLIVPDIIHEFSPGPATWSGVAVDIAAYGLILVLAFIRLPFRARATLAVLVCYVYGAVLLARGGFSGTGPYFLFAAPILTALLFGLRSAMSLQVVVALTLLAGAGIHGMAIPGRPDEANGPLVWSLVYGNFLMLGTVLALALALLLQGFESAATEARETKERFRSLVEHISDGIAVVDAEGIVRYQTPAVARLTGHSAEDRVGASGFTFIHPDDISVAREALARVRQRPGALETVELRLRHRNGSVATVDMTAKNLLEHAAVRGIVVTYHDITQRVHAERRLEESEKRYRLMVEGSEEVFFFEHDAEHRFTYLSPSVQPVLGYEPEELLGRPYETLLIPGTDEEAVQERTATALKTGRSGGFYSTTVRSRSGEAVVLEIVERPVIRDGTIVGLQGIARDISGKKKLEDQFRQAQKMEALGRLAGGVAHDFNNILTTILGQTQLFLDEQGDRFAEAGELHEVVKAAERARDLTRQLLAFSRQQFTQHRVVALNRELRDMEKMLGRLIGEDLELVADLAPDLQNIEVDPSQIHQVVLNLAVNAKDAMPGGGTLRLTTRNVDLEPDAVDDLGEPVQAGHYVMLAVSDTGHGMDEATRRSAFEPFFTTKEQGKGTGLGLATVYGIVEQSRGHIRVRSEPGVGTTFEIYLPRVDAPVEDGSGAEGEATLARERLASGTETILVAEDEDAVRALIAKVLRKRGHTVLEARNGREAIRLAEEAGGTVHLLLTDVVMPEMGGRELAERTRTMHPEIRVMFMSGYTSDEVVRRGISDAEVAFLEKPFAPAVLAARVREVLDGEGGGGERG